MWITLFALAIAGSVWFSAANLAIQLRKDQVLVNSVIESRGQPRDGSQQFSSAVPPTPVFAASQID
jgi:hypothetical protein